MKIIELIGFPGSGKTTILDDISYKNVQTINSDKFYFLAKEMSTKRGKIKDTIFSFISFINFYFYLFVYIVVNVESKFFAIERLLELVRYVTIFEKVIKRYNDSEIIVFDQAIVQYIWSLTFNDTNALNSSFSLKRALNILKKKFPNYTCVYLKVPPEVSASRSHNRASASPMDSVPLSMLKERYEEKKNDWKIIQCNMKKDFNIIERSIDLKLLIKNCLINES